MEQYEIQQRIYYENGRPLKNIFRKIHDYFGVSNHPHKNIICNLIKKFESTSSVDNVKPLGRKSLFVRLKILQLYEKVFQINYHCKRFIDSYKFVNISLDKLASFLNKDKLQILQRELSTLSVENFDLLTRKDVFPYE